MPEAPEGHAGDESSRTGRRTSVSVGRSMIGIGEDIALPLKIVVAGGFGAGKTTLVGSVSEIRPLHPEETLSGSGQGQDDAGEVERKATTTVAMDFGRITVHSGLTLHLFGTPGQDRFRFLRDELCEGVPAAIVLTDPRRLGGCFAAVDYFERGRIPFVVAVNRSPGAPDHTEHDVPRALDLDPACRWCRATLATAHPEKKS